MKRLCLILLQFIIAMSAICQASSWGIISLCCVHLRQEPRHSAELITQAVMGTPVMVLDTMNDWYYIETPEGYKSWVHPQSIALKSQAQMDKWRNSTRYIYTEMNGYAYNAPHNSSTPISDMVLGCIVEATGNVQDGYIEIVTPDGRMGYVKDKEVRELSMWSQQEFNVERLVNEAFKMMGTTYLWGGTSTKGVDCSGFTKILYYSQGIIIRRDASQQATTGDVVDHTDYRNFRCGDLLFFGNDKGRVTHVAIYLNNGQYIHSSGRVKINSVIPGDNLYNGLKVIAARRIITAVDSDGIRSLRQHPWFF